jgi:hypothetical protein
MKTHNGEAKCGVLRICLIPQTTDSGNSGTYLTPTLQEADTYVNRISLRLTYKNGCNVIIMDLIYFYKYLMKTYDSIFISYAQNKVQEKVTL